MYKKIGKFFIKNCVLLTSLTSFVLGLLIMYFINFQHNQLSIKLINKILQAYMLRKELTYSSLDFGYELDTCYRKKSEVCDIEATNKRLAVISINVNKISQQLDLVDWETLKLAKEYLGKNMAADIK